MKFYWVKSIAPSSTLKIGKSKKTLQELRMLSSVTLYCQVTMSGVEDLNCLTCTLVLVFSKCLCLCFLGNSNDLTYVPKSLCVWWVSERQGHLELSSDSAKNTETQIYKITQIEGVFCQFFVCFLFGVFCHPWSLTRVVKSGEGLRVILVLGCFYKGWGPIASLKQNQDVLVWFGYNLAQLVNTECFRDAIVLQPLSMRLFF